MKILKSICKAFVFMLLTAMVVLPAKSAFAATYIVVATYFHYCSMV